MRQRDIGGGGALPTNASGANLTLSGYLVDAGRKRVSTQFDKTNNTRANITDLVTTVVSGEAYSFEAHLYITCNTTGLFRTSLGLTAGGGQATMTSLRMFTIFYDITDTVIDNMAAGTALNTAVDALNTGTGMVSATAILTGTFVVNAGGTIAPAFAQATTNAGASSVLTGSWFHVMKHSA